MDKIKAAWEKFQDAVGADVAIAIAAGIAAVILIHPVVGIIGALVYLGVRKGIFKKALGRIKDQLD